MKRTFDVVSLTLASAVANAGTFAVGYPAGCNAGTYTGGYDHMAATNGYGLLKAIDGDISLSFGTSSITVTNNSGSTLAAGTEIWMQLDRFGDDDTGASFGDRVAEMGVFTISLGAPDAIVTNGICQAQSGAAGALTLNGSLVSGGVATLDVPRNLIADSGGADTAVLTITGTDEFGETVVENITLNGTTAVAGKKAFKTVTSVVSSATISNGAFLGTGDVLGLPMYLKSLGHILKELEDGAAATAGTPLAGVTTTPSATTGDVRGTYDPNSACDGSKSFQLVVLGDPSFKGRAQYAG